MKFSTQLAISALLGKALGRKLARDAGMKAKAGWVDAALAAFAAKNELLDKDGVIRNRIENGAGEDEVRKLNEMRESELRAELEKRETNRQKLEELERERGPKEGKGVFGNFVSGFVESRKRRKYEQ